jgi:hypothetical protein
LLLDYCSQSSFFSFFKPFLYISENLHVLIVLFL